VDIRARKGGVGHLSVVAKRSTNNDREWSYVVVEMEVVFDFHLKERCYLFVQQC